MGEHPVVDELKQVVEITTIILFNSFPGLADFFKLAGALPLNDGVP